MGALILAGGLLAARSGAEPPGEMPTVRTERTKHGGAVRYARHWNWWARTGGTVAAPTPTHFAGYEADTPEIRALVQSLGAVRGPARTEAEVWRRAGLVWSWWREHVKVDNAAYATLSGRDAGWPTMANFARYFKRTGGLVCAACFSKAHLYAMLLGRIVYPRERMALAYAHHTQAGAPPTASHVYVALYVAGRWLYLDPTHAPTTPWPAFASRRSLGPAAATSIDYEHPFKVMPLPGSSLAKVPLIRTSD